MRVLVITQDYPKNKALYPQHFIHTRNLYYKELGIAVDVLSFNCKTEYLIADIKVYPSNSFQYLLRTFKYQAIICHAPNIRNHIRLLLMNLKHLPKIFFVFHGHEILIKSRYYPPPYKFKRKWHYIISKPLHDLYDHIKLIVLGAFIKRFLGKKLYIIFVSQYLKELFLHHIVVPKKLLDDCSQVIGNTLKGEYLENSYSWSTKKPYDFITIRPYDNSVCAINLIIKIAEQNPQHSFHIIGKGDYFLYNKKPNNVEVFNHFMDASKIVKLLDNYKAALMPSFHDSQGVMMCEMAAFGMPMVVSNIPAHREMMSECKNIYFIDNQKPNFDAAKFFLSVKKGSPLRIRKRFSLENSLFQEIKFIVSPFKGFPPKNFDA